MAEELNGESVQHKSGSTEERNRAGLAGVEIFATDMLLPPDEGKGKARTACG